MPSKTIGTGNKKGAAQRPNTSNTSPRNIRLQKRRATALALRLSGRTFRSIAKELRCSPQTAFNYIVDGMRQTIPKEAAEQVYVMQMARLDMLLEKYQPLALGEGEAAEKAAALCLKISNQRCRLAGLYPSNGLPPMIFNTGGENPNIRVSFVQSNGAGRPFGTPVDELPPDPPPDPPLLIETQALPALPAPEYRFEPPASAPSARVVPIRPSAQPPNIWERPKGWMR